MKKLRINERIRVPTILLVEGEEVIGKMPTEKAIEMAKEKNLDLVEVSPLSDPPVCKIMDYGDYQYKQKKNEQKQKRAHKKAETKTIRLSIRTEKHDLEVKAGRARKFLNGGHPLKVVVLFRGREMAHGHLAKDKLDQFFEMLKEDAVVEQEPKRSGYQMIAFLIPGNKAKKSN